MKDQKQEKRNYRNAFISFTLAVITLVFAGIYKCNAQESFVELYKDYKVECAQIVTDTLTESGVVNYTIDHKNGLRLIPKDTVWVEQDCHEYKEGWGITSGSFITYDSTDTELVWTTTQAEYGKASKEQFSTNITREKYCRIKTRRPTLEGFWEWLNDKIK